MVKATKTTSKNNPTQRNRSTTQKLYDGRLVKPVMYINRAYGVKYVAAQYDDGAIAEDKVGNPLKWSNI